MNSESTKKILDAYSQRQTIKYVVKETKYSWPKVVKTLSSEGIVINEQHGKILELHKAGRTAEQISKITGISERTVKCYLPRVRGIYGENLTENAKRIKKCIEKKRQS